jgi:hypothetical protein
MEMKLLYPGLLIFILALFAMAIRVIHLCYIDIAYFSGYRRGAQGIKPGSASFRPKYYENHYERGVADGYKERCKWAISRSAGGSDV